MKRKVVVLGASENPNAYSNKAVRLLNQKGFEVIAIGKNPGYIDSTPIQNYTNDLQNVDVVTVYLSPQNQISYYDWILNIKPQKVIFNPGAENRELQFILEKNQIPYENACTLVLLNFNQL